MKDMETGFWLGLSLYGLPDSLADDRPWWSTAAWALSLILWLVIAGLRLRDLRRARETQREFVETLTRAIDTELAGERDR